MLSPYSLPCLCQILTFCKEDTELFSMEFSKNSGINIIQDNPDDNLPLIYVGWSNVKSLFPGQRISNHKITENIFWVYSVSEDKPSILIDTKSIIQKLLKDFLPHNYITYDSVLDGKFSDFLKVNFEKPYDFYVYFSGKAMYLYSFNNPQNIYGINLESMSYIGLDIKKTITQILKKIKPIFISYDNISSYISDDALESFITLENIFWARNISEDISEHYFNSFLMSEDSVNDKYIPFMMSLLCEFPNG